MGVAEILTSIDREIALLQQARTLLAGAGASKKKVGRPKKDSMVGTAKPGKKKRNLTPEGRKRIAEAVKRRWEAQRKAASAAK